MERELELLAPAGTLKTLKAVLCAGADAVYFGGTMFGARAYAGNFNREEVLEAIDFGHIHDKKVILAVNTLLKNEEIQQQLYEYLLPYYVQGLDAVIVQDFGVMQFIRENFPKLPIHTSTQMTVTGAEAAAFLAQQGASRIVMARELSCEEIAEIHRSVPVEIESFVHGALCYSYSGACLFSSMLGGRSGNRGRCAQPCRLPYEVYDAKKRKQNSLKGPYVLSPKDLCTIENIPKLAESGVYSFKIEGRMKQTEYAAGVVSIYRKYMDAYLSNGGANYKVAREDMRRLLDLGNRSGFTEGCYHQWNGADMITFEKPGHVANHQHLQEETASQYADGEIKEKIYGFLRITKDLPVKLIVTWEDLTAEADGEIPTAAQKQPLTSESARQKIQKTGGTPYTFEELEIECEEGLFLPVQKLNELRREALDKLTEEKLSGFFRKEPVAIRQRLSSDKSCPEHDGIHLSASIEEKEQLKPLLEEDSLVRIYLDSTMFHRENLENEISDICQRIKQSGKEAFFVLPSIFRKHTSAFYRGLSLPGLLDGFLVKSYDALAFLLDIGISPSKIILDHPVYTYSDWAKESFKKLGIAGDTVPLELNKREIKNRNICGSELVVYGCLPLMTSVHCVNKNVAGCSRKEKIHYLKDRYGMYFPVKNNCNECYNTIYNSKPLCLFGFSGELIKMGVASIRLSFTFESAGQVKQIFNLCREAFFEQKEIVVTDHIEDFTYGHYKRGVE